MRGLRSLRELIRPETAGLYDDMAARFGDAMRAAVRTGSAAKRAVYTALDDVEKAPLRPPATSRRSVISLTCRL